MNGYDRHELHNNNCSSEAGAGEIQKITSSGNQNNRRHRRIHNEATTTFSKDESGRILDSHTSCLLGPSLAREESSSAEGESSPRQSSEEQWRSRAARILYRAGLRREARGRLSAAIGLYRQALKLDPGLDERSMYIEDHVAGEEEEEDSFSTDKDDVCREEEEQEQQQQQQFSCTRGPSSAHVIGDDNTGDVAGVWKKQAEESISDDRSLLCPHEGVEVKYKRHHEKSSHRHLECQNVDKEFQPHVSISCTSRSVVTAVVNDKRRKADERITLSNQGKFHNGPSRKGTRGKKFESRKKGEGILQSQLKASCAVKPSKKSIPPLVVHDKKEEKSKTFPPGESIRIKDPTGPTRSSAACTSSQGLINASMSIFSKTARANESFEEAEKSILPTEPAAQSITRRAPYISEDEAALPPSSRRRNSSFCEERTRAGETLPVTEEQRRSDTEEGDTQTTSSLPERHLVKGKTKSLAVARKREGSDIYPSGPRNIYRSGSEPIQTREKLNVQARSKPIVKLECGVHTPGGRCTADVAQEKRKIGGDKVDTSHADAEKICFPEHPSDRNGEFLTESKKSGFLEGDNNNSKRDYLSISDSICTAGHETKNTIISCSKENVDTHSSRVTIGGLRDLPSDLLLSIPLFLDAYSLTRLSMSCRVMQDLYGNESIRCWEEKCIQMFGSRCITECHLYGNSWHRMYLERPRLRMDGIYISRSVYLRRVRDVGRLHHLEDNEQENRRHRKRLQLKKDQELSSTSVQLISALMQNAQSPVLAVSYHRYLRFLPSSTGSHVLILRTEAEKTVAVQALKIAEQNIQAASSLHVANLPRFMKISCESDVSQQVMINRQLEKLKNTNSHSFTVCPAEVEKQGPASSPTNFGPSHMPGVDLSRIPVSSSGGSNLSRGGRAWQWLLPLISVGEYAFDPQSKRLHVFYNEPRSSSCNRQSHISGDGVSGSISWGNASHHPRRRQDTFTDSRPLAYPSFLNANDGQENLMMGAVSTSAPTLQTSEQDDFQRKKREDIFKSNKKLFTPAGRSRRRYTHRAVFELCSGGPPGRNNSRLRWICRFTSTTD